MDEAVCFLIDRGLAQTQNLLNAVCILQPSDLFTTFTGFSHNGCVKEGTFRCTVRVDECSLVWTCCIARNITLSCFALHLQLHCNANRVEVHCSLMPQGQ